MPPVTGKPEHPRQPTVRSGVLTSTSSRRRGAFSDCIARTNGLRTRSSSSTDPLMPQPAALPSHPNVSLLY